MDAINTRLDSIRAEFNLVAGGGGGDEEEDNLNNFEVGGEEREGAQRQPGSTTFAYHVHFFDVSQAFGFPKVTLREGLRIWLRGQSVSTDGAKVVKPFRKLTLPGLPGPSLKNKYKVQWKPIFSYMEENGAYKVSRSTQQMTDGEIERIYDQCVNFLKDDVSYCFQSRQLTPTNWGLETWSLKTRRSTILKKGTEADKAKVVLATNQNQARRPSTRPGRQMATNPLYRYGTDSVSVWTGSSGTTIHPNKKTNNLQERAQDDGDAFGNAFENVELSEAAHARGQEIEQEVNAEL
jgi:hypothetical protein